MKVLTWLIAFYAGKISSWIDLDSDDETLRIDSETTLKQEVAWASHLSLQVCFGITKLKKLRSKICVALICLYSLVQSVVLLMLVG